MRTPILACKVVRSNHVGKCLAYPCPGLGEQDAV